MNKPVTEERLTELRENHGPWHYTEFGVLCSCGEAMDANEECPTLQLVSEIDRLSAKNERLTSHLDDEHYCQHDLSEPAP